MRLIDADELIDKISNGEYITMVDKYGNNWMMPGKVIEIIDNATTADLSEYCDKLWKTAYERGKQEVRPIRCNECKYWDIEWIPAVVEGHYCPMMDHVMVGDEWCCYGERRESDG